MVAFVALYDVASHVATGDTGSVPRYSVTFKGTGVDWYATKTATSGNAGVYVDGVLRTTVDLYSATTAYQVKVFASVTLAAGVHTLEIRVTGTPHAGMAGTDVTFDRIVVR